MNRKRTLFHGGLFLDGMRQLRLTGILFAVLYALTVILGIVISAASGARYTVQDFIAQTLTSAPKAVDGVDVMPVLFATIFLVAPVMTLQLFGFLNRRRASDLYHALPCSRGCLYFSLLAAVFAWLLLLTLGASLLGIATTALYPSAYTLLWKPFLLTALGTLVAGFAVSAGITLAMSVTGTRFTNIIVSLLVLFLPRLLISMVNFAVAEALPLQPQGYASGLLSGSLFLPYALVKNALYSLFTYQDTSATQLVTSGSAIAYTAGLAVVYTAIARILFARRRSESAARSAPGRKTQAFYRILVCFSFCAVCIAGCFPDGLRGKVEPLSALVLAVIALLLYFLYELLTTKSFRRLLHVFPGLGLVALCCLAFFGTIYGIYHAELSYQPTRAELKSVSVLGSSSGLRGYFSFPEYVAWARPDTQVTDEAVITMLCEELKAQTDLLAQKGFDAYQNEFQNPDSARGYLSEVKLCLRTKWGSKYRVLYLTREQSRLLNETLLKDAAYAAMWTTLPELQPGSGTIENVQLSQQQVRSLYDSAKAELAKKSISELSDADLFVPDLFADDMEQRAVFTLRYTIASGAAQGSYIALPLSESVFPETVQSYYDMLFEQAEVSAQQMRRQLELCFAAPVDKQVHWQVRAKLQWQNKQGAVVHTGSSELSTADYLLTQLPTAPHKVGEGGKQIDLQMHYSDDMGTWSAELIFWLPEDVTLAQLAPYFPIDESAASDTKAD